MPSGVRQSFVVSPSSSFSFCLFSSPPGITGGLPEGEGVTVPGTRRTTVNTKKDLGECRRVGERTGSDLGVSSLSGRGSSHDPSGPVHRPRGMEVESDLEGSKGGPILNVHRSLDISLFLSLFLVFLAFLSVFVSKSVFSPCHPDLSTGSFPDSIRLYRGTHSPGPPDFRGRSVGCMELRLDHEGVEEGSILDIHRPVDPRRGAGRSLLLYLSLLRVGTPPAPVPRRVWRVEIP